MNETMRKFSPVLLRVAMALVMLWFGTHQLLQPEQWFAFLPSWTNSLPISQTTFVYLNGWFEVSFGVLLFLGFYTRIVALLLGLHLLGIAFSLGYTALGVRDFGLALATLAVFFYGSSGWSLDMLMDSRSKSLRFE